MSVYLFPGQGSQFKGMGKDIFDSFPELIEKAESLLGYSLRELCLEDPHKHLHQTCYTQPALYVVNALSYLKKQQETGIFPDFVAGHSLGEYNALLAAGVFDFETGLQLVKKRGALMNDATGGVMAAILRLTIEDIKNLLRESHLTTVSIANHNSYTQIVLSGLKDDIWALQDNVEQKEAMFVPLQVSGAFHSPYMKVAQDQFEIFLKQFSFSPPKIPVISNYTARPYRQEEILTTLSNQITHTVRWVESIEFLKSQGQIDFEEIGPGTVLTGLMQRIQNGQ